MDSLLAEVHRGPVRVHQVFGANLFIAHAIDYIAAIRKADGIRESRVDLVRSFDELFSVGGARIANRKFELIDAINNSLKHISLDADRYRDLFSKYGPMTFRSLVEERGLVLCIVQGYRFDYTRVVLRQAYRALSSVNDRSVEGLLEFARGEAVSADWTAVDELMLSSAPEDAIDQMIAYCNPLCEDCGEGEGECQCAEFEYDGAQGHFVSRFHASFDFDAVMSRISGAYRKERS
ncbi:MAG: hypothetical protein IV094_23290 [Vitreoscilla sp.]|nr:hypothetical protein [Vitreoscilla sp.]